MERRRVEEQVSLSGSRAACAGIPLADARVLIIYANKKTDKTGRSTSGIGFWTARRHVFV